MDRVDETEWTPRLKVSTSTPLTKLPLASGGDRRSSAGPPAAPRCAARESEPGLRPRRCRRGLVGVRLSRPGLLSACLLPCPDPLSFPSTLRACLPSGQAFNVAGAGGCEGGEEVLTPGGGGWTGPGGAFERPQSRRRTERAAGAERRPGARHGLAAAPSSPAAPPAAPPQALGPVYAARAGMGRPGTAGLCCASPS